MAEVLSGKRLQILNFIADSQRERGYPPSVREIGEAVGLTSSATVHTHLAVLQREGYLSRDPSKPRAIQVHFDPQTETIIGDDHAAALLTRRYREGHWAVPKLS